MSRSSRGGGRLQTEDSEGAPRRHSVDKRKSAKAFNETADRTKAINTAPRPMRGGIRL